MSGHRAPRLCLAASGGGHIRQLLDLEPLWQDYPHFFVTEDTALGRSLTKRHETYFVPHFALGQARLGSPLLMLWRAAVGLIKGLGIILRKRPDVLITTGAGSQLFITFWARLIGARVILIDSFARFDGPSAFARLAGPLAHRRYAQSAVSAAKWPGSRAIDPLKELDTPAPPKEELTFVTVGATLPFPRLAGAIVGAMEEGWLRGKVVLQTGKGAEAPAPHADLTVVEELDFDEVQALLRRARLVICHGGTGSILTALRQHCQVIVMPRQFDLGEHYDDHQSEITANFEQRGLVASAHDLPSLRAALEQVGSKTPCAVTTDYSELIAELRDYIEG